MKFRWMFVGSRKSSRLTARQPQVFQSPDTLHKETNPSKTAASRGDSQLFTAFHNTQTYLWTLWRAISARNHRRGARIPLNIFKIHAGPLLCRPARAARFAARRRSVAPAERARWARELLYLHQRINGHILSYLSLRLDSGQNPWYLVVSLFFEIEL